MNYSKYRKYLISIMLFFLVSSCSKRSDFEFEQVVDQVITAKNHQQKIDSLSKILNYSDQNWKVLIERGFYYLYSREDQKSLLDFSKVLNIDGQNIYAQLGIANNYIMTNRIDDARKIINSVISENQNIGFAYYLRAGTYENVDLGINDLDKCIKINKDFHSAFHRRAIYNYLRDSLDNALDDLNYLIRKNPKIPKYYITMNMVYEKRRDYTEMLNINKKMWTLFPEYHESLLFENLKIYKKLGDSVKIKEIEKQIKEMEE